MTERTENGHCPTCGRRETITVKYEVTRGNRVREGDTYTTVSASCRHGHDVPGYVGERD